MCTILRQSSAIHLLQSDCAGTISKSESDKLSSLSSKFSDEILLPSIVGRSLRARSWRRSLTIVLCWRWTVLWSFRFSDRSCSIQRRTASKVVGVRVFWLLSDSSWSWSRRECSRSAARARCIVAIDRRVRSRRSIPIVSSALLLRLAGSLDQRDKVASSEQLLSFIVIFRIVSLPFLSVIHAEVFCSSNPLQTNKQIGKQSYTNQQLYYSYVNLNWQPQRPRTRRLDGFATYKKFIVYNRMY